MQYNNNNNNNNNNNITIITEKTIDVSNETLIETFNILQITNGQFNYFFI